MVKNRGTKYTISYLLFLISLGCYLNYPILLAQESGTSQSSWTLNTIANLETRLEGTRVSIRETTANIQKCDATISKSERILDIAQQKGNVEAEQVSLEAIRKAKAAKVKNSENLALLNEYQKKLNALIADLKKGNGNGELKAEQFEFQNNNEEWLKNKDTLIRQRYKNPNQYVNNLYTSLKANAPPPLPGKKFDELLPGDVLLISKDSSKLSMSYWINKGDEVISSTKESSASHTLIYLKSINGKKMFLDNLPGKGPMIISEQEYLYLYGSRDAKVAQLIEPLEDKDGEKLYQTARQLADEQLQMKVQQSNNLITGTKYGVIGTDMVCSESSRWVLINSGKIVPETDDAIKKLAGIDYSPADFCKSRYFIVTPLYGVPTKK